MPADDPLAGLPADEPPQVEVWLDVGEAVRIGDCVLRLLDTDGQDTMLRVESSVTDDDDETRWAELPR